MCVCNNKHINNNTDVFGYRQHIHLRFFITRERNRYLFTDMKYSVCFPDTKLLKKKVLYMNFVVLFYGIAMYNISNIILSQISKAFML